MPYIPSACVITILYPEGNATIATDLRCLTTHASSLVNAIILATKLDCSDDGLTVAFLRLAARLAYCRFSFL